MDSVNLRTFPQLGAFPYEVGTSNSVGGINNSGMWNMNLPLSYWYNYGSKKKRSRKLRKKINRRNRRYSRK